MVKQPTAVVTGASSGVGLYATKALTDRGWHVVMACRSTPKAHRAAAALSIDPAQLTILPIDLGDMDNVRIFVRNFLATGRGLQALVCNAAVYLPRLKAPQRSPQGFEISVATNHLGHLLLSLLMLPRLAESAEPAGRLVTLGTVTANSREFGGLIPIPAPANLGTLSGLSSGFQPPVSMIDSGPFKPGKAYKDSKLCNMIISREMHRRFHEDTGVVFSTLYPGCVADTALFRHTPLLFRKAFPWFQKNITRGYVTQALSGERVADVVTEDDFAASGVHWSWGNRQKPGRQAFSQPLSDRATNHDVGNRLWDLSLALLGQEAPEFQHSTGNAD